jgi:RND family efflux transporter MFP subunit
VTDRHVVVGDDVEPSRHLFEVADLSAVLAIGRVFEAQIGRVAVGQKVRVRVPSYPGDVFEGVVERLGGKLDPTSRSLAVYVRVANPDERLRPHMRATLSLITGGADLALAIPKSALLGEAGQLYVFVQDEDRPERFERRALVLGVSNDRFVEVIEGLYPGERVVTEGNYSLQYLTPIAEERQTPIAEERQTEEGSTALAADPHAVESPPRSVTLWALGALGALGIAALAARMLRGRRRSASEAL